MLQQTVSISCVSVSLWQITMLIMKLWSCMTPRVIFNCHLLIVEFYGHKAVEYGVKYNLILVSQTIFIHKYSCPSCILRTLLKNHLFLTNVIVFGSFENIYLEQCSPRPILEWRSTTFLTFQHHLKISSTALIFSWHHLIIWVDFLYLWPHFNCKMLVFW